MPRVKRGVTARRRHKKVLEKAKGYYGARSRVYRVANEQVMHSLMYAYRHRRERKRDFRRLWITRINAAARLHGLSYNHFIHGLKLAEVDIDRKILSELAVSDPDGFKELVEIARSGLSKAS